MLKVLRMACGAVYRGPLVVCRRARLGLVVLVVLGGGGRCEFGVC